MHETNSTKILVIWGGKNLNSQIYEKTSSNVLQAAQTELFIKICYRQYYRMYI